MGKIQLFLAACSCSNKEILFKNFQHWVIEDAEPDDHDVIEGAGVEGPIPVRGISVGQRYA